MQAWSAGHREGSLKCFGWTIQMLVDNGHESIAENVYIEAKRRYEGGIDEELEKRGVDWRPI
jgi:hypothetical protein